MLRLDTFTDSTNIGQSCRGWGRRGGIGVGGSEGEWERGKEEGSREGGEKREGVRKEGRGGRE